MIQALDRTLQGIVRGLSEYIRIEEMHYTHIRRRILKIKPSVENLYLDGDNGRKLVTLIVDASGLTITKKCTLSGTSSQHNSTSIDKVLSVKL